MSDAGGIPRFPLWANRPSARVIPGTATGTGADRGGTSFSLSDTRGVRETFNIFRFEEAEVSYICSNGKNLKSGEVLIRNF